MTLRTSVALSLLLVACGPHAPPPDAALTASAAQKTNSALSAVAVGGGVLEVFRLLPAFSCGPVGAVVNDIGRAIPPVQVDIACAELQTSNAGLTISFARGCRVGPHSVEGSVTFAVKSERDQVNVSADFQKLFIDARSVPVSVGYDVCTDHPTVWLAFGGALPNGQRFTLDTHAAFEHTGLPLIGHDEVILDGTAALTDAAGTSQVLFDHLRFDVGSFMPKEGELTLNTADGHTVVATFSDDLEHTELDIDACATVSVSLAP